MKTKNNYLRLFLSTLYLSAFTFGGGYVIITLMKKKFVDELKWIDEEEMLNIAAISQSLPGLIAVNASILIGYKMHKIAGAIVATLGTAIPPLVTVSIISVFYNSFRDNAMIRILMEGMQVGIVVVIFDVVVNMVHNIIKDGKKYPLVLMVLAFIASYIFKVNVFYIIIVCGIAGIIISYKTAIKQ